MNNGYNNRQIIVASSIRLAKHLFGKNDTWGIVGGDQNRISVYFTELARVKASKKVKVWEGYPVTYKNL